MARLDAISPISPPWLVRLLNDAEERKSRQRKMEADNSTGAFENGAEGELHDRPSGAGVDEYV